MPRKTNIALKMYNELPVNSVRMSDEQFKELKHTLDKFIAETRQNFAIIFKDREVDRELLEKLYGQEGLGGLKSEFYILRQNVESMTHMVKQETQQVKREVQHAQEKLEESPKTFAEQVVENLDALQEDLKQVGKMKKTSLFAKIFSRTKSKGGK